MSGSILLSFARWRLEIDAPEEEIAALVRRRYGGFLDGNGLAPGAPAASEVLRLAVRFEPRLDAVEPTRFAVERQAGEVVRIHSGALEGTLDLRAGSGRAGLVRPETPGATASMPGMALENYLRIATAILAPRVGAALVHSAAVSRATTREAVLLHGRSGAGKSTSAALSAARDPRHRVLADDLVVVDVDESGRPRVHSTPFWGDDPPGDRPREPFPIAAICELAQANEHRLRAMPAGEAVGALASAIPFQGFLDRAEVGRLLDVAAEVTAGTRSYTLHFSRDSGFWQVLEGACAAGAASRS